MVISSQPRIFFSFSSPQHFGGGGGGGGGRKRRRGRGGDGDFDGVLYPRHNNNNSDYNSSSSAEPSTFPSAAAAVISSPSNPFVKHCVKLRLSSSYRRSCGSALVVGLTPIVEISSRFQELKNGGSISSSADEPCVDCLFLLDDASAASDEETPPPLPKGLTLCGGSTITTTTTITGGGRTRVVRVSPIVMKKLAGLQSTDSTKAVAVMKIPKSFLHVDGAADCCSWFPLPPLRVLVLDGIQDPGNLGTLLRSAMAFKWDGVFLLPGCCDPFNEKALRAARGASFQLPIVSGDWIHLEALRNKFQMKMLAAHPGNNSEKLESPSPSSLSQKLADSLADVPLCLVLGSEGHGLSKQTMHASELVSIPMAGNFESLNVSVAGGIFLFALQTEHGRSI